MIDVGDKKVVHRTARASGKIKLTGNTMEVIRQGRVKKGDVFTVARVAGIAAVKDTPSLIPFCHPIPVHFASVDFEVGEHDITCRCEVRADYKTGVEMEALTGAAVALLTIWDMVKYLEKDEAGQYPDTEITSIVVTEKSKEERSGLSRA
ncbi:MAG: cyclic pyranopterin monophosphate synthase MoaC [Chloroflexota bacterium]